MACGDATDNFALHDSQYARRFASYRCGLAVEWAASLLFLSYFFECKLIVVVNSAYSSLVLKLVERENVMTVGSPAPRNMNQGELRCHYESPRTPRLRLAVNFLAENTIRVIPRHQRGFFVHLETKSI